MGNLSTSYKRGGCTSARRPVLRTHGPHIASRPTVLAKDYTIRYLGNTVRSIVVRHFYVKDGLGQKGGMSSLGPHHLIPRLPSPRRLRASFIRITGPVPASTIRSAGTAACSNSSSLAYW